MLAVKTLRSNLNIFRRSIWLMGNQFEISLVANDLIWAESKITDAINEINRVDKLLSALGDNSKVNEINRNAGVKPVKVDPEIFRLIDRSLQISALTYGAFDITYVSADKAADVKPSAFVNTYSNYKNVVLDPQAVTVFLKEKGMRISFASIGKGYAADRAKYILQMQGVSSGVINAGGDLLTWGTQPNNADWTIGAADPELQTQPFANLNIGNMCIATSVNAERHAAISNRPQVNMVNAKKGFPVSEIMRVSVISPTAELSDAMATPIMNMGVNAGLYLINQLNQISCLIIDDHNRIYTSKGIDKAD
ncbi:thiamine biosynthesis lipoprotein [Mucilaginibacter mallensis]|uniref:FAD:protein FMN transferase n=1 Tax=Mucilaginibacter mallensis TaxID=652787 RepID=A0A1H1P318_MUCMA|nr:FAD:protein FMN transferase [Mucilaginibacter mallensis]SDS04989.1 thiamine biosynthesis lipoprotein [Mucilaginibacter mallensis]